MSTKHTQSTNNTEKTNDETHDSAEQPAVEHPAIEHQVGTIVHVAPATLLLTRNVREARPDAGLVRSVTDLGVLDPITAVLTDSGGLLVRFGHRRALAAIEAKRPTVPVYITATDDTAEPAEVRRIIAQRDENTHRQGLNASEEVDVVEQLAAFGLSAAQIAKQGRIQRTQVDAALVVSGSTLARKATARYAHLTLDQAAVVANFEDDAEAVKALVVAASEGRFEHVAQRARDDRAEAQATAQVTAALDAEGVTLIERPGYDSKVRPLDRLTANAETREALTMAEHVTCPGHVAWVGQGRVRVDQHGTVLDEPIEPAADADDETFAAYEAEHERFLSTTRPVSRPIAAYGCANWRKHAHHDPYDYSPGSSKPSADEMTPQEREEAKQQRRLVIENNKAWSAAAPVRRGFLQTLAKTKTPPKGAARFLAAALSTDASLLGNIGANHLAADLLSKPGSEYGWTDLSPAKSATDNRYLLHALVIALAAYEADLTDATWRGDGEHNAAGRYLRFLNRCGYDLAEVEQYAISADTA